MKIILPSCLEIFFPELILSRHFPLKLRYLFSVHQNIFLTFRKQIYLVVYKYVNTKTVFKEVQT